MPSTPLLSQLLQQHGLDSNTFDSLFDIVGQSKSAFVRRHGSRLGASAASLYDDALRRAVPLARRHRTQRRGGSAPAALVDGQPTYQSLFQEDWHTCSPEDALEANDSPVIYLCQLYQWAQQMDVISDDGSGSMIPLATRRPDLASLVLDRVSTDQTVTALSLVNEILSKALESYTSTTTLKALNDKLAAARFPFTLPYDYASQQITRGLDGIQSSLMSLTQQLDPAWPYFLVPELSTTQGETAQQQGSQLSTEQYTLLTEAHPSSYSYPTNYGVADSSSLKTLSGFCSQTGLAAHDVQDLLCSQGKDAAYSVVASPNVTSPALKAQPNQYGAVYIHGNSTTDPSIMTLAADSGDPDASTLTNTSDDRFDRMSRFIRLRNWMQLPFDQLDLLLTSTMKAEGNVANNTQPADLLANANTVRMLGVFRELNRSTTISAETFAAWVSQITPYAVGNNVPFYDRLFNSNGLFSTPLVCDGSAFSSTIIKQLSAGLGITQAEYELLAVYVTNKMTTLTCSLPVFSAFYRLVTLPRAFGLSVTAGLGIINLLGSHVIGTLAGKPPVNTAPSDTAPDILDIIVAFAACADWIHSHDLSVAAVTFMVHAPTGTLTGTPAQTTLIDGIVHDLASTLLTVDRLIAAGAPQSDSDGAAIDWGTALDSVLDASGLVIDQADLSGAIDTALAAVKIDAAASQLVKTQLLTADTAQQGVTIAALSGYLDADPDYPLLLLQWAGSDSYTFLSTTLALDVDGVITPTADYLMLLYTLGRIQAVVVSFALSAGLVQTYVNHPDWFGTSAVKGAIEVTLGTLYGFSRYNDLLDGSTADESALFDYLADVNAATPPSAAVAAKLLAALIDWSDSEVANAAAQMEPSGKIATTLQEIDGVRRQQALWQQTGLSAELQIQLSALAPSSTTGYAAAGESVVAGLNSRLNGTGEAG
ncbi:Tc toxin subunit A [Microvirgula aerodenitrificans]|uniref:Tc toxin subunit A n=1 Tax=Microvirgula aerodenitrificans TaxID=57480 RepID=UPI002F40D38E